jgi:hypothetical protein
MIDEKPYLVSLDKIEIGDKVIVTVGGQYPSLVECSNEQVMSLITDSRLKLTQPFKVFLEPEKINLNQNQIETLLDGDGLLEIVEENGIITYNI